MTQPDLQAIPNWVGSYAKMLIKSIYCGIYFNYILNIVYMSLIWKKYLDPGYFPANLVS